MTSLLSFSNLVDGAAAPVSETFEKLQPLHRAGLGHVFRGANRATSVAKAEIVNRRVSSDQVPLDRYDWQDRQFVRHDEAPDDQGRSLHFSQTLVSGVTGSSSSKAKVVIVGGAIVGSFVAYFLQEMGFSGQIQIVERDPTYRFRSTALSAASIAPNSGAASMSG